MQEIMNTVLMLSLSGTFLAGILFLLRPLYRRRLSKRWQYYIWLVVIARLLVPWSLISVPIEMIHTSFEQPAAESKKPEPSHTTENKIPKELPAGTRRRYDRTGAYQRLCRSLYEQPDLISVVDRDLKALYRTSGI